MVERIHVHIDLCFNVCVFVAGKERESRRRNRKGAGFRASSAVHGLTNYLWNCCIHSHLNRNLSERRKGPVSPQHTAEKFTHCRTTSSTKGPATAMPSSLLHYSTTSPLSPLHVSPFTRSSCDDGLSLMQIYNHFICQCPPPLPPLGWLQEHSSTSYFQDVHLKTASIISLLSISLLHKSQLDGD